MLKVTILIYFLGSRTSNERMCSSVFFKHVNDMNLVTCCLISMLRETVFHVACISLQYS
jgi:hypothetical protein